MATTTLAAMMADTEEGIAKTRRSARQSCLESVRSGDYDGSVRDCSEQIYGDWLVAVFVYKQLPGEMADCLVTWLGQDGGLDAVIKALLHDATADNGSTTVAWQVVAQCAVKQDLQARRVKRAEAEMRDW